MLRKLAVAAAIGLLAALAAISPAFAGGGTKTCPPGDAYSQWCDMQLYPVVFPGGTISIDVDVVSSVDQNGVWKLYINGGEVCHGNYSYKDPARSWVCRNVPRGYPTLSASKPHWVYAYVGLRW
jgi:hypothetical protein